MRFSLTSGGTKRAGQVTCLETGNVDLEAGNASGLTPLHEAATDAEDPAVIQALIAVGADVAARTEEGHTPLHNAASENPNPAVVEMLLAAGADVAARDEDDSTPLHAAAQFGGSAGIGLLLDAGANAAACNAAGQTPWDLAQENETLKVSDAYRRLNNARFNAVR